MRAKKKPTALQSGRLSGLTTFHSQTASSSGVMLMTAGILANLMLL
jgi:hypothetical protein